MQKNRGNPFSFRSEFWGIRCESGKKYSQVVKKKFHITMAALDPSVGGTGISLMVERGGSEYLLCNLQPGKLLQVNLNLFFDKGENVTFYLKGRGVLHLSGYHILQNDDEPVFKDSIKSPSPSPIKKESKSLDNNRNNSLDSDIDIEEESDSDEDDYEDSSDDEDEEEEDTKPNKNPALAKVTPTRKADKPGASPAKKEALVKANIKAAALKAIMKDSKSFKNIISKRTLEESSDEDSDEDSDDSSDEAQPKQKSKDVQSNKKLKTNTSTPMQGKKMETPNTPKLNTPKLNTPKLNTPKMKTPKLNTPKPSTQVIDLDSDAAKSAQKSFKRDEMNSSIGRTPMPKKSISSIFQSSLGETPGNKKNLKNKPVTGEDEDSDEMGLSSPKKTQSSSEQLNTTNTPNTESKKKRKKKKKKSDAAANDSQVLGNTPSKLNEGLVTPKSVKKLAGGLEYEDIKVGYGLEAKKGKLVHVFYTGKLENNKVFDSIQPGSKPFSFKLGSGQVIRGWDVGLEGMKVGGKRKLKIPPHLGYKSQRVGDIPPSSTLNFVVELKAVS